MEAIVTFLIFVTPYILNSIDYLILTMAAAAMGGLIYLSVYVVCRIGRLP